MVRKVEREIPRASRGPTRRALTSRWPVDNSVDGYLLFLIMGSPYYKSTQFHTDCWIRQLQREISSLADVARYSYRIIILANLKSVSPAHLLRLTAGIAAEV